MHPSLPGGRPTTVLAALLVSCLVSSPSGAFPLSEGNGDDDSKSAGDPLRLTDDYLPMQVHDVPARPKPLLELGLSLIHI